MNRRSRFLSSLLVSYVVCMGSAAGQDYPTRPITVISPFSAGSVSDIYARAMAPEMSRVLGQPISFEYKPSVNGVIGFEYVARQVPANGYAMTSSSVGSLATLPLIVKDLRFDPLKDLVPVIGLAHGRYLLGSASRLPWKTFNELISHAKANPGKLNYGASSISLQLLTEMLIRAVGVDVVPVPYSAIAPWMQALGEGEVQMGFVGDANVTALGDKFRVLAVTGRERHAAFPNVPTFSELGYPEIPGISYALNVRAGTPQAVIDKLHAAASRALQQPEVKDLFAKLQLQIDAEPPDVAAKNFAVQAKIFAETAKRIGFQPK